MTLSHRMQLNPTKEQVVYFKQACGVARFTWNWCISEWEKQHAEGLKPSGGSLRKQFNSIYKEQFPWVSDVLRDAHSQPFINAQLAYNRFFKKTVNKPVYKKKGKSNDSFYVANDKFSVDDCFVKLPRIGKVRMAEELRFKGKIIAGAVSREADRWFLSIAVEGEHAVKPKTGDENIGVDLGVKTLAVCSDGTTYKTNTKKRVQRRRVARLQRRLSRKKKGSANRNKAREALAKLYMRIKNAKKDTLHKMTTEIIRKSQAVCIEDLNVKGMLKNRKLSRSIGEQCFGEVRRQLTYKAAMYGVELIVADRFYPSSKTCSTCGNVKKQLKLSDRTYRCGACGNEMDRDLNAAINLSKQIPMVNRELKPVDRQITKKRESVSRGGTKQEQTSVYSLER